MSSNLQLDPYMLIFTILFSFLFGYAILRNRVYTTKVNELSRKMSLLLPKNLIEFTDTKFSEDTIILDDKYGTLSLIADKYNKGYDFIIIDQPKVGAIIPVHKHNRTKELFYMLEGELTICLDETYHPDCVEHCLGLITLKPHDWYFIQAKKAHCIKIVKPAKYIIIAKPPLFSRIGKLYEKLFKKEKCK